MNKNSMNKFREFVSTYKVKIIVYSCLLAASLIVANHLLKSTYDYVVTTYERNPNSIQICEDGIKTLSRMKYYKNSKNYIKEMKQSIVQSYCDSHQFEEAKNYLDKNFQEGFEYLYHVIEDRQAQYEEEERHRYMESREGRTERVYKMYETMGLGGENQMSAVPRQLISKIEYGTLDDIGYLLPVWNRNEKYFDMLKSNLIRRTADIYDPYTTYYVEDWHIVDDSNVETYTYEQYLSDLYDINIEVEEVDVIEYDIRKSSDYYNMSESGKRMLVFKTEGKYFLGGIYIGGGESSLGWLIQVGDHYNGILIDEYYID